MSESCIKESTSNISRRVTSGCHPGGSQSSWCYPDPLGASVPRAQRDPSSAPPPGYRDVGGCGSRPRSNGLGLRHNAARVQRPPLPRQARERHKSVPLWPRHRPPTLGSRVRFPQRLGDRLPDVAAEQAEQQCSRPVHLRAAGAAGRSGSPRSVTSGRAPRLASRRCGAPGQPPDWSWTHSRPLPPPRPAPGFPRPPRPLRQRLNPSCSAPRPRECTGPGLVVPPGGRRAAWRPRTPSTSGPVAAIPCSCSCSPGGLRPQAELPAGPWEAFETRV